MSSPDHVYAHLFPSFSVIVLVTVPGIVTFSFSPFVFVIVAVNVMLTESGLIPSWLSASVQTLFTFTLVFSGV